MDLESDEVLFRPPGQDDGTSVLQPSLESPSGFVVRSVRTSDVPLTEHSPTTITPLPYDPTSPASVVSHPSSALTLPSPDFELTTGLSSLPSKPCLRRPRSQCRRLGPWVVPTRRSSYTGAGSRCDIPGMDKGNPETDQCPLKVRFLGGSPTPRPSLTQTLAGVTATFGVRPSHS